MSKRSRVLSSLVGLALLGTGGFMAVHATLHPSEHHPAWWLIAAIMGLGGLAVFPETMREALTAAKGFLPWGRRE